MEKYLDITKLRYSEKILPIPWLFDISRFHCTLNGNSIQETASLPRQVNKLQVGLGFVNN